MPGKVENQSFTLLANFDHRRWERSSETVTSHLHKPLAAIWRKKLEIILIR